MAPSSGYNVARLLLIGIVFHVVYIAPVFDCYFRSPVVHGMQSYQLDKPEAKRLVLIVGDGLRADMLFTPNAFSWIPDAPEVVAPYLRSIAKSRGAYGVSHTRVPTESRPGHVALIGGMYEDVSAVTKGWKTNPVDFDSVLNRSSHTFSFGSPDILPMFSRGASPGKVDMWTYNEEDEDFTKDATALDIWVLDRLRDLLHNSTSDASLNAALRKDGTVFFLHLLGLDTTGHAYRPHSKEYMNNIRVVDGIVRETEALFTEFFKDEETSFVFTADHGMSNIGNHGDGDPDNTRTPLIAWGRGIRGPLPDSVPSSHDNYSVPWGLGHLYRRDLDQADVAALMAALIGIPWPVNCVGVLPDVDPTKPGYLNPRSGDGAKAMAALVNTKVILDHYRIKHERKQNFTRFYKPFIELEGVENSNVVPRTVGLEEIETLISQKDWYNARLRSAELIDSGLRGLRYLQTYDRLLISGIVTAAYLGWAAYSSLYIFQPPTSTENIISSAIIDLFFASALFAFWTYFLLQDSPWTFYVYILFPCYFWQQFTKHFSSPFRLWLANGTPFSVKALSWGVLVFAGLQSMVAAYTHRSIWSVWFAVIGVAWPLLAWPIEIWSKPIWLAPSWIVCCLSASIFPMLPVEKSESLGLIMTGAGAMLLVGAYSAGKVIREMKEHADKHKFTRGLELIFGIQLFLLASAMIVTCSSVLSLQARAGLPFYNQLCGWVVFVTGSILPFLSPVKHPNPFSKMLMHFLGLAPCFVILSISVEGLFYLTYSMTLLVWIHVEAALRQNAKQGPASNYTFQLEDLRIAMFFLFFVQVGFFGTGNVASISSFYLEPVYRLVPIFNPFLMAALLVFKIVAPYVMLSASFATLNARLNLPPFSLFCVALTLTDGMTLSFFYNVTDTGSWLEIGQSISFFCITSLLLVWSGGICAAGELMMEETIKPWKYRLKFD